MMKACKCGSYAINHNCHGRDGSDDDLCDVCYWRKRAEQPAQQEPVITARQLSLATRQWDHWKAYALELQERLVKYEGGSPMVLNTSPPVQQQEPVAWVLSHSRGIEFSSKYPMQKSKEQAEQMASQHRGKVSVTPLYTSPQPAQRKPLTDEQWQIIADTLGCCITRGQKDIIEAAHNIKENT